MARARAGEGVRLALLMLSLLALDAAALGAEVLRVVIEDRQIVLDGRAFGEAGAYEKLTGRIHFAIDPEDPRNQAITDLQHAVRNADGHVEAWADLMVLQPADPSRRRGIAWVEVSNRGGKASLAYFNRAGTAATDPSEAGDFGDGFLMNQALTIIWVGWQHDVPDREGLLRLHVPLARGDGEPLTGPVRADWVVDRATDVLDLGHRSHRPYPPVDPADPDDVLTVRDGREAPRDTVPRDQWEFVGPDGADLRPEARAASIRLDGGFEAGRIYELVYEARHPQMVGLGLAAIRDVLSHARYDLDSEFPVSAGIAFGVSQTGRFLRHFLYEGFNTDESGRKVYDGMLIHTAGAGRGSFNHRFAQPSRDGHRYSAFFYPTDLFPFSGRTQRDPVTGRDDGLLRALRPEHRPLVFYTNTGYEYWGRAASLVHTSTDGRRDVEPLPSERIYHLTGAQHFVGGFPPPADARIEGTGAYRGNPVDFLPTLRALADDLLSWVEEGVEPPPSRIPRIADGTLVPHDALAFPPIPGVRAPDVVHVAYRADYGPRFRSEGVIEKQPPELGPPFPSQVPQVDGLGNEISGLRSLELRVPLATYTPWSLRHDAPAATGELADFVGTYVPLPRTPEEAEEAGDPRPSIEVLYDDRTGYMERVRTAIRRMVGEGLLLPIDVAPVVERAEERWEWVMDQ